MADCISRGQDIKYNWLAKSGWMCGRPDFMCETRRETRQMSLVADLATLRRYERPVDLPLRAIAGSVSSAADKMVAYRRIAQ